MKKLSIISFLFLSIFLFSSCDMVQSIINYFVDIEPSKTEGTENTEFTFKANTNDIVDQWIIDGAVIPASYVRSANDNDLVYSFSSGTHTIGVLTNNGATDEVTISVSPVETVFNISAITGENTTEIYLDYPLLTIDGSEYNIETTGSLNISNTETHNIISIQIIVDQTDSFCFINNNAMEVYGIDLNAVTISQMHSLFLLWYPERYIEPEPEIPFYSDTRFSLGGHSGATSDHLKVFDEYVEIDSETFLYVGNAVYMDDLRIVVLSMQYDNKDSFLFINGNMFNFFGISFDDMSYSDFIITADILNRYPEEGILDLMEIYP